MVTFWAKYDTGCSHPMRLVAGQRPEENTTAHGTRKVTSFGQNYSIAPYADFIPHTASV